ncbi:MAG: serine/threonine-protein kinase [Polyangiaceae bacterium]
MAVKFMSPPLAGPIDLVARFEREARAAAQIRSPHVVQIFEHGIDGGLPFIVMELLEGEDLGARMRRVGRLPLAETARIVAAVCKALRRAHAMGIVHRDLKPANVFLARSGEEDDEEIVKVLDFGVVKSLAEAVESGVTKTGELIGTPHYMSPEQARSTKSVDHRSDLWSLGIIAYRALTASLPFPDEEGLDRLMRICSEPIPPPSTLAPDLDPDVDAFFSLALAIDPDFRFQTAREMSDAIRALVGAPASVAGGHSPTSSLTGGPSSSTVYTAQAYVYTSASNERMAVASPVDARESSQDSEPPAAVRGELRASSSSPAPPRPSVKRAAMFPFAADLRASRAARADAMGPQRERSAPSGSPSPEGDAPKGADAPTRVSGIDAPASRPLAPHRLPPPVAVVGAAGEREPTSSRASARDTGTLSNAGLSQSRPELSRLAPSPHVAVGLGLALVMGSGRSPRCSSSARIRAALRRPISRARS